MWKKSFVGKEVFQLYGAILNEEKVVLLGRAKGWKAWEIIFQKLSWANAIEMDTYFIPTACLEGMWCINRYNQCINKRWEPCVTQAALSSMQ